MGASDEFRGAFLIEVAVIQDRHAWTSGACSTGRESMIRRLLGLRGDALWLLTQQKDKQNNCDCEHGRSEWAAERQSAALERLVEEIANRCSERSGQNERGPEKQDMADLG